MPLILFALPVQAKVYNSFMCYSQTDTVVLFGILTEKPMLQISYGRLENNPTWIDLKVTDYSRQSDSIAAQGLYKGKKMISLQSQNGWGKANIDLTAFPGTENTRFSNEDILCYFGRFQD